MRAATASLLQSLGRQSRSVVLLERKDERDNLDEPSGRHCFCRGRGVDIGGVGTGSNHQ